MAEHVHLKNDFTEDDKYHYLVSHLICFSNMNKVMVIILMHPFVINPLFKTVFFSLYHYDKYKANSSAPLQSQSVNELEDTVSSIEILCLYRLLI